MLRDHVGQRGERQFVSLARTKQAEARITRPSVPNAGLNDGIDEWEFGHAVRDDVETASVDTVCGRQEIGRGSRHDDGGVGPGHELGEDRRPGVGCCRTV